MLSQDQKDRYIKQSGIFCPKCTSSDLDRGSLQTSYGHSWRLVECQSCLATWRDMYNLDGVCDFKQPPNKFQHAGGI